MKVAEVMTRNVQSCTPETNLSRRGDADVERRLQDTARVAKESHEA
ncbi:MAG TPA: hypothetical protein VF899_05385 [Pyrinomonadaceae bacterium]